MDAVELGLRAQHYEITKQTSPLRALELLALQRVDVIVSDERMPGLCGTELLARAYELQPEAIRILLTGHASMDAALRAINQARVTRFLCKPCPAAELRRVIAEALAERSPQPMAAAAAPLRLSDAEQRSLSVREHEVLALLADGLRVSQIAKRLFISTHTVRNHLKMLYRKLGIHSQAGLIEHARGSLASCTQE